MKKTRRWLSLLVAVCLTASLFPAGAVAEENVQEGDSSTAALNLGASVIAEGDTVYFGTYDNSTVSWKVLSTEGNGDTFSSATDSVEKSDALFLLSDTLWYRTAFNSNYANGNTYSGSTLQSILLDAAKSENNNFTDLEAAAILKTTKDAGDTTTLNYVTYTNPELDEDTLFALSADELVEYLGYKADDDSTWSAGVSSNWWWLRSAYSDLTDIAGIVHVDGDPRIRIVYDLDVWARPAFNLNLNSVLFTSAAAGGKSSGAEGADALEAVSTTYTDGEWKLTLKDESRNFAVESVTVSGNTLTVSYSGATIGTNEYISAIVVDSDGNITYYGRIKSMASGMSTSGEATITLPSGFNASTDTLYLFSEQYNGDKNTDYASALQKVSINTAGAGTTDPEGDGSAAGTTDTTGSETDSSTINTAGSTGTTASGATSTSSDTSTSSASSDSSLPQTGDTSTALLLGTVATLGLSALVIALSLAQRRRYRVQGAHVCMR